MRKWFTEGDPFSPIQYRYAGASLLYSGRSEFQAIEVLETEFFGRMLVLDKVVQVTQRDEFVYHEMLAHVPLHSHPTPQRVLVVGGGDGGTLREVLKHPTVASVTVVELDPKVIEVCRRFLPGLAASFSSPKVTVHNDDGAHYLRETSDKFDIILVDGTDPVGPALTLGARGFFETAARALTDQGLFAMQTESLHFHASHVKRVQDTLRDVFASVALYSAAIATYAGNWWTFSMASRASIAREPVRPVVGGTRLYCEELHRAAFVPAKVLDCFTALPSAPARRPEPSITPPPS